MSLKERRRKLMIFLIMSVFVLGTFIFVAGYQRKTSANEVTTKPCYVDCTECTNGKITNEDKCSICKGTGNCPGVYKADETGDIKEVVSERGQIDRNNVCPTCKHALFKQVWQCSLCGFKNSQTYGCEDWTCMGCPDKAHGNNNLHNSKGCIECDGHGTIETTEKCPDCNGTGKVEYDNHDVTKWYDDNNGKTHTGNCKRCNEDITEAHTYVNGVCTKCGAQKPCEHTNYIQKYDANQHWKECEKCGEKKENSTQEHYGGQHEAGLCKVCGYKYQNHGKSTSNPTYKTTESGHTPIYSCTEPNCPEKYEGVLESHKVKTWKDNGNGTHSGTCNICGYELTKPHNYNGNGKCEDCGAQKPTTECTHNYVIKNDSTYHWEQCSKCNEIKNKGSHTVTTWTDNGNGTHSGKCNVCGYSLTKSHNYNSNGKCEDCGAQKPTTECTHNYVIKNDSNYHWDECSKCSNKKNIGIHIVGTWTDNGDGTHSGNCTVCNYKLKKSHSYNSNGKCEECGAQKLATECEHKYTTKNDSTYHWKQCSKCNEVKNKEKHTVTTWTDNGDGTHTGSCSGCEYKITETHTITNYEDNKDNTHTGTCSKCNCKVIEKHSNGNTADCNKCSYTPNSSSSEGKDDTKAPDKIPQTGDNSIVIISSIMVLIAIASISLIKLNRYK